MGLETKTLNGTQENQTLGLSQAFCVSVRENDGCVCVGVFAALVGQMMNDYTYSTFYIYRPNESHWTVSTPLRQSTTGMLMLRMCSYYLADMSQTGSM